LEQNQNKDISSKLNLISHILKLGHEAFRKETLDSLYTHILNNSRIISAYDMSCIIEVCSGAPKVVGIMGNDTVSRNAEYCMDIEILTAPFFDIDKPLELNLEHYKEKHSANKSIDIFNKILKNAPNRKIFLIPLKPPHITLCKRTGFIWLVEYYEVKNTDEINKLNLLARHYSEALWYLVNNSRSKICAFIDKRFFFRGKIFWCLLLFLIFLFLWFFRIEQNISAEFELIPKERVIEYAPYSGIIKDANFENGDAVKEGDIILRYDTDELLYDIEKSEIKCSESSAKLDMTQQKSFKDVDEIGKVKLLSIELNINKVELEKYKWYLNNGIIKAKTSGIVVSDDKYKLKGKGVTAGEKLFEVIKPEKVQAEVLVNEADSSVVSNLKSVTLYLHSMPELSIESKIISISPVPVLVENKQFCYVIRAELVKDYPGLIYGMRGVSRVTGAKVSLGYYLFRNVILWWRKI